MLCGILCCILFRVIYMCCPVQPGGGEVCEHRAEDGPRAGGPAPGGRGYRPEEHRKVDTLIPRAGVAKVKKFDALIPHAGCQSQKFDARVAKNPRDKVIGQRPDNIVRVAKPCEMVIQSWYSRMRRLSTRSSSTLNIIRVMPSVSQENLSDTFSEPKCQVSFPSPILL